MVSLFKTIMVALPFVLQAAARPSGPGETFMIENRLCIPPSNCGGPIGDCEFCCAEDVSPDSEACHTHGRLCQDGSSKWHCDDTSI